MYITCNICNYKYTTTNTCGTNSKCYTTNLCGTDRNDNGDCTGTSSRYQLQYRWSGLYKYNRGIYCCSTGNIQCNGEECSRMYITCNICNYKYTTTNTCGTNSKCYTTNLCGTDRNDNGDCTGTSSRYQLQYRWSGLYKYNRGIYCCSTGNIQCNGEECSRMYITCNICNYKYTTTNTCGTNSKCYTTNLCGTDRNDNGDCTGTSSRYQLQYRWSGLYKYNRGIYCCSTGNIQCNGEECSRMYITCNICNYKYTTTNTCGTNSKCYTTNLCGTDRNDNGDCTGTSSRYQLQYRWSGLYKYNRGIYCCSTGNIQCNGEECSRMYITCNICNYKYTTTNTCGTNSKCYTTNLCGTDRNDNGDCTGTSSRYQLQYRWSGLYKYNRGIYCCSTGNIQCNGEECSRMYITCNICNYKYTTTNTCGTNSKCYTTNLCGTDRNDNGDCTGTSSRYQLQYRWSGLYKYNRGIYCCSTGNIQCNGEECSRMYITCNICNYKYTTTNTCGTNSKCYTTNLCLSLIHISE